MQSKRVCCFEVVSSGLFSFVGMIAHLPTQPSVLPFEHARIIWPFSGFEPSLSRPTHTHTYLMVNEWKNITKTITHRTHKHVLSERLPTYKSDNPRIEYTTQHNMAIKPAARTSKEAMFTRVHSSVPSFGSFRPYTLPLPLPVRLQ